MSIWVFSMMQEEMATRLDCLDVVDTASAHLL